VKKKADKVLFSEYSWLDIMESCLQGKLTTEEETLDRKKVEGCWARGQNYSIVIGLDLQPVTSWSADLCALFTPYWHQACSRAKLKTNNKKMRYRRNNSAQRFLDVSELLAIVGRIYRYLRACQTIQYHRHQTQSLTHL
jgi:hypothetical protein